MLVDCIHTYTSRNLKLCNLFIDGYEINYINPTFHCLIIDSFQGCACFQKWCLFVVALLLRLCVFPKAVYFLLACFKVFMYIVECKSGSKLNLDLYHQKIWGSGSAAACIFTHGVGWSKCVVLHITLWQCQKSLVPMQCGPWMPCRIEECASVWNCYLLIIALHPRLLYMGLIIIAWHISQIWCTWLAERLECVTHI